MRQEVAEALERAVAALGRTGSAALVRWARFAAMGQRVGKSVLRSPQAQELLVALSVLVAESGAATPVVARSQAAVMIGDERFEALLTCRVEGAERVKAHARRRAQELSGQGTIGDHARFIVAGTVVGALDDDADHDLDVATGPRAADDVFDGPVAVQVSFLRASDIAMRAA
jgi:hypothetical protein